MRISGDWKNLLEGFIDSYKKLAATVLDAGLSLTCMGDPFLNELGWELLDGRAATDAEVASVEAAMLLQEEHQEEHPA